MSTKNNNTLSWRVGELEKQVGGIDKNLDSLLQNHLPHLHEKVSKLETKINVLTAVNIGGIIIALIINKFL